MLYKATYICAGLGTAGLGIGLRLFDSLHWLWQIPLLFAGLWLSLVILALLFLLLWCAPISLEKPVEEDSPADRRLLCLYSDFALSLLRVKRHITGMEKLPQHGRFLLVCNHLSILDPVLLLGCMKTSQLAFISKRENNRLPVVNKLMHKTLCQLINRDNDRDALLTILKCVDILKQDKANIAVFPEGYTSRDGHLQPFRNGVFKIAYRGLRPSGNTGGISQFPPPAPLPCVPGPACRYPGGGTEGTDQGGGRPGSRYYGGRPGPARSTVKESSPE